MGRLTICRKCVSNLNAISRNATIQLLRESSIGEIPARRFHGNRNERHIRGRGVLATIFLPTISIARRKLPVSGEFPMQGGAGGKIVPIQATKIANTVILLIVAFQSQRKEFSCPIGNAKTKLVALYRVTDAAGFHGPGQPEIQLRLFRRPPIQVTT